MKTTARRMKVSILLFSVFVSIAFGVMWLFNFSARSVFADESDVGDSRSVSESADLDAVNVFAADANSNKLVIDSDNGADWVMPDTWTYGDELAVSAPHLLYGDEADPDIVSFGLVRNGEETICEDFARSEFSHYINDSMPVGSYCLTATVEDFTDTNAGGMVGGDGDASGNTYTGGEFTYDFAVEACEIGFTLEEGENGYGEYEWLLDEENRSDMFVGFAASLQDKLTFADVVRAGYWATSEANAYFGDYEVKYNLARMHNNSYYTSDRIEICAQISRADTYIVYFNISAPNHADLVAMGDARYDYFFKVVAYSEVETPFVNDIGLTYTGTRVLPQIYESDIYEIVWNIANDDYVDSGSHEVSFRLYDSVHYRWADGTADQDTITVEFEIQKAENRWLRTPNVVNWAYDSFDIDINRIRAVPAFIDKGKTVVLRLTTDAEGLNAVEGLERFIVDINGRITDRAIVAKLNELAANTYYMFAEVEESKNYKGLSESVTIVVGKAGNAWSSGENDVILPGWIIGEYDPNVNAIAVRPEHGIAVVVVKDFDGNEYFNSATGKNILADAPIGKYFVVASVAETDNYAALAERTFIIEVFEKAGMPWWGTLCIALGAVLAVAIVLIILWKTGVFNIVTDKLIVAIRTKASVDATIASVRAAKKMEDGKKAAAAAKRKEAAAARRAKAAEERNKPAEERAAALEEKARKEAERAEKIRARAEAMQAKAERVRQEAQPQADEPVEQPQDIDAGAPIPEEPTITADAAEVNAVSDNVAAAAEPSAETDASTKAPAEEKQPEEKPKAKNVKKPRAKKPVEQPATEAEAAATDNSESPAEDRSEK